jgi:uncharacterized membrane protein (UPF0127 family)
MIVFLAFLIMVASNPQLELTYTHVTLHTDHGAVMVDAQVANDVPSWSKGLMHRIHMPPQEGMLFVFPQEEKRSFWMRNTPLELDMIFIGNDHRVVGIVERAAPNSTTNRSVDALSRYVLETHGGFSRKHGIHPGTRVSWAQQKQ